MAVSPLKAWQLLRKLEDLLSLEKKHGAILDKLSDDIDAIKDRLNKLEAREEILVAEAKGASAAVASSVASQHLVTLAQQVEQLKGRLDGVAGRLPPPNAKAQ